MNSSQGNLFAATVDEAIEWYMRNRSQRLSSAEQQAFAAWLRASPLNVREYLAIAALSNDLRVASDASGSELTRLIQQTAAEARETVVDLRDGGGGSARPRQRAEAASTDSRRGGSWIEGRRMRFALVAVLVAGLLCLGALFQNAGGLDLLVGPTYVTEHGEQRTVRLPDGTLVHLNSASRAAVRFTNEERRIRLDAGQLMFEVAPDPARPFKVRAGGTEAVALGTKFEVYRKPNAVIVTVIEGRVEVSRPASPEPGVPEKDLLAAPTATGIRLAAGEQVSIGAHGKPPVSERVDVPIATAWLQGNIRFERKPLADVAAEFNRYAERPVEIEGESLRALRVSGIFKAYDTESFVEFLRGIDGVRIDSAVDRIVVSERPR